jgi:hypothetical protein
MSELHSLNERAQQRIEEPNQIADVVRAAGQFQETFTTMSHHTSIITSMNEIVQREGLIDIGELEQNIVTIDDANGQCERLLRLRNLSSEIVERLLILYALRYEGRGEEQIERLCQGFPEHVSIMRAAITSCGSRKRGTDDQFVTRHGFTQFINDIQSLRESVRTLDQHRCQLGSIIERIKRGTLEAGQYPFVGRRVEGHRVRRLMVFYVGGATYKEMRCAVETTDLEVVIGGTTIHNAMSFIRSEVEPFAASPRS